VITRRGGSAALLSLCLALLALWPAADPVQAKPLNITVSGSGLVVHGIPLPAGAEPTLAANLSLEELQVMAAGVADLGRGRLQAVVYTLQIAAPPDAVADFYERELRRPVVRVIPQRADAGKTPDDGIRVLSFTGSAGYLAIRAEEATRPSRVTVAVVEGTVLPATVLKAVDSLLSAEGPKPGKAPALLSAPWESTVHFEGIRLELLKRSMEQGGAAGPVVDVRRALLRQARSLSLMRHQVSGVISPLVVLTAFRDQAHLQNWRLTSVESVEDNGPPEVVALYCFPNNNGMVMLRAGPPPRLPLQASGTLPGTEITLLEVMGSIDFAELFRPMTLRPRPVSPPAVSAPAPRGPFSAQRTGPYSAQRRR
jgi:hypothetical protein